MSVNTKHEFKKKPSQVNKPIQNEKNGTHAYVVNVNWRPSKMAAKALQINNIFERSNAIHLMFTKNLS